MVYTYACQDCGIVLPENLIQESHDVPCYLFEGNRKGQKNQADKFGRHMLCGKCHKKYENSLKELFRQVALDYSHEYFKEGKKDDTNTT